MFWLIFTSIYIISIVCFIFVGLIKLTKLDKLYEKFKDIKIKK